jgi:nucleoside-diphosphate-sugar epimerase
MEKILISGASGWLGNSTLRYLEKQYALEKLNENLQVVSTSNKNLDFFPSINTKTYEQLINQDSEYDGFIHLASLTKDKSLIMNKNDYIGEYLKVTSNAVQLLQKTKKWFVFISSGAIWEEPNQALEKSIDKNPYGFLKRLEENLFTEICKNSGITYVCGRLWGGAGFDLREPEKYALGSLILNAINNENLQINSGHKVYRRYVDTKLFMELCIKMAQKGMTKTFDSGGEVVEIQDIAEIIRFKFPKLQIIRTNKANQKDDEYYSRNKEFEALLKDFDLQHPTISELIEQTIIGLQSRMIL